MHYKSKPNFVTAIRWFKMGEHPKVTRTDKDLELIDVVCKRCLCVYKQHGLLNGYLTVCPGDWVLEDSSGYYVVSDERFLEKFEPVT